MTLNTDRIIQDTFILSVEHHAVVSSTNDVALQCASQGCDLPLLVVADQQTAGRGRGCNRWWTGGGSLAFSLLVEGRMVGAHEGPEPLVALAIAVAVVETLAPKLPHHTVGIHWPNDVMVDDRKMAGILVEALPDRRHIIGIGINTNNCQADAPTTCLSRIITLRDLTGLSLDHTDLLIEFLILLEQGFATLRERSALVAAKADELCLQKGRTLTLRWADRSTTGLCRGIAADGALMLDTAEGLKQFYSGSLMA